MNNKLNAIAIAAVISVTLTACAQTKSAVDSSKKSNKAVVLQATKQTTLPGRPESKPTTDYKIIVVWKKTEEPKSFFWRGERGWQSCHISKVTDFKPYTKEGKDRNNNYKTVQLTESIKANDTLELSPSMGGKFPVPAIVKESTKNTLFYKTATVDWTALPVDSIIRKRDIVMP